MPYSPERDERVMTLLELALNTPAVEREACLRAACGGDEPLFEEILERARWEEKMGGFLLEPLVPRVELDHPFTPGQFVSERFEIVREVAEGGMAVVYEAIDRKLDQRIAVKCPKVIFRRRLPPEARSALQVSHPNICRVHGIHTTPTDRGEVDFLTMEFLDGETLLERLRREKRLGVEQAREIARQICAGLEEAHRQGIVHGDLKSNNIILTKSAQGQLRAVITDFGLARQAHGAAQGLTHSSNLRGTPAYLAPELWAGQPATPASDIYAVGVILYELVTGQRPSKTAAPPSQLEPGLDRFWDRVILKCLDPAADRRYSDAGELSVEFDPIPKARSRTWLWTGLIAAALILLIVFSRIGWQDEKPESIRLAILPVLAAGVPDEELLGMITGVLHDLSVHLRQIRSPKANLLVIPMQEVRQQKVQTPAEARLKLGATHVLNSAARREQSQILVTSSILDTRSLLKLRELPAQYSLASFGAMPRALTGLVTAAFQLPAGKPGEQISSAAYAPYAQAVFYTKRDNRSADIAIPLYERAITLDPKSPLPHAGLAEALILKKQQTGDPRWLDQARTELQKAESLNPDSPSVRIMAGTLNRIAGWNDQAVADYQRALDLDPRDADAWRGIGKAYEAMNRSQDAINALTKATEIQPEYYAHPLSLGILYYALGRYQEAEKHWTRVVTLAPGLDQGHVNLGALYADMGRFADCERESGLALQLGQSRAAFNNLGAMLVYQGKDQDALAYYAKAKAIGPATYIMWMNLGDSYRRVNRPREAGDAYQRGYQLAEDALRVDPSSGLARSYFAYLSLRVGDRATAERDIIAALHFAPNHAKVIRRAAITFDALGKRNEALAVLQSATPDLLRELSRQPDLADLRQDPRYQELVGSIQKH